MLKTWYFAFFKGGRHRLPGWMEFCTRDNFSHIVAFSQVENFVQVIDPQHNFTDVLLQYHPLGYNHPLSAEFIAVDFSLQGATVVCITWPVDQVSTMHHYTNLFPGCVTFAKSLLGVADWVFTPWQFLQWLLEHGGEEFTDKRRDEVVNAMVGRNLTDEERANIFSLLIQQGKERRRS